MKNETFATRYLLPIALPVLVVLTMAAFIGSIALSLLFNTHEGSLMLAAVAAAGILFTVSLASGQDRLGGPKRGVIVLAAFTPLVVGGLVGLGVVGGVADEDRMINVQPLMVAPDDAPTIAAENSSEFCIGPAGACEPITEWEVTPSQLAEEMLFVFDNFEAAVAHNVVITDLEGGADDPASGATTYGASTVIEGIDTDVFRSDEYAWDDLPDEWYFFCAIHPNMNGVGRLVDDA
ncbi:MAG: hypothetical protein WD575_00610 [Nitriliruptoraceae bacterium]